MQRFPLLLIIISIMICVLSCGHKNDAIRIPNVRFEDGPVNLFFDGNENVYNINAVWDENMVKVYYQLAADTVDREKFRIQSFHSEDGYSFSLATNADKNQAGHIVNLAQEDRLAWNDIVQIEKLSGQELAFVLQTMKESAYRDMVFVPGGSFPMGSSIHRDEQPVHKVELNSFYIDKYEVTVAQYRKFCQATRRTFPEQPEWSSLNHPVVNVSWFDAKAFAEWNKKRLPTEAEWEYAAKSGIKNYKFSWGNGNPTNIKGGNIADEAVRADKPRWAIWTRYYDGFVYTAPVGTFRSNEFGVYDLTGNVWEWCQDWYDASYYANSPSKNPAGPAEGSHKVLRGGSWNYGPKDIITSRRMRFRPRVILNYVGFRCVIDAD